MKMFNYISLIVMTGAAVLTWNTIANATPTRVHMLENLSPAEQTQAIHLMLQKGFIISKKGLFEESKQVLIITKTLSTESDEASIQIELVKKEGERDLPKTTYLLKVPTSELAEAVHQFPSSDALSESKMMPVAFQE